MILKNVQQIKIEHAVKAISYLIGIIAFVGIYEHIYSGYSIFFLFMLLASMYFEYRKNYYIPRWVLTSFSVLVVLFFLYKFDSNELITQTLEALLVLLGIKFLEKKQVRDYMQIYAIALFLLSGLGLMTLGIDFVIYFLILVFLLSVAFVLLTYYAQDSSLEFSKRSIVKLVAKCLWIPLLAIPLSVLMFIILPRTQYPLLDFLNRPDRAKTGFTDRVRLGEVSNIQEDASIVFRANMEKIDENTLYWRGIALDYFDGTSWRSFEKRPFVPNVKTRIEGRRIRQMIYLEPYQNVYLFGLDKPVFISTRFVKKYDDLSYSSSIYIDRRMRYEVLSIVGDAIEDENIDEKRYLQVPEKISSRITGLVDSMTRGKGTAEKIGSLYAFLHDGAFKYSLQNLPVSKNPLETFLFESKYGNCEYFASTFAIMLRIAGIPSRVIGGYRGGYYNDVGQYYLIPQKNAHVWVEAFIPKKGWLRYDPTPASLENFAFPLQGGSLLKARVFLDTVNYYWYALIINYNLEKQISFLRKVRTGIKRPSLKFKFNKGAFSKYLLIALLIVGTVFIVRLFVMPGQSREKRLLSAFLQKMEKYGYRKKTSQGLEEFVLQIDNVTLRGQALTFVRSFEEIYFHDKTFTRESIAELRNILASI
jgi:transglutaminase-like putative cysteine protease